MFSNETLFSITELSINYNYDIINIIVFGENVVDIAVYYYYQQYTACIFSFIFVL